MPGYRFMFSRSLGLLRQQSYRNLFAAVTASAAGVSIARIAIPMAAVIALKAGDFEVGLVSTFLTLPYLLIGLPVGVWVDQTRRRSVMILCQMARGLILLSIPLSWWAGILTIRQLFATVLLFGACNVFYDVAYQSYLPHLVGRDNLLEGNSKLTSVQQVFTVAGPAFGGQLVAVLTAPIALLGTSIGLALASWHLLRINSKEEKPERKRASKMLPEIAGGLRFVYRERRLLAIAGSTGWLNLTGYAAYVITLLFLARVLKFSPAVIGVFLSVTSIGGLLGAFTAKRISLRVGQGPIMWLILLLGSPFAVVLPLVDRGWTFWLASVASGIFSFMTVVYNVAQVTCTQMLTPDSYLGRVNGTMKFLTWSVMPLGSLLGGAMAGWLGIREALLTCTAAGCLAFLPIFISPLRRLRELSPPNVEVDESARAVRKADDPAVNR